MITPNYSVLLVLSCFLCVALKSDIIAQETFNTDILFFFFFLSIIFFLLFFWFFVVFFL